VTRPECGYGPSALDRSNVGAFSTEPTTWHRLGTLAEPARGGNPINIRIVRPDGSQAREVTDEPEREQARTSIIFKPSDPGERATIYPNIGRRLLPWCFRATNAKNSFRGLSH
jgi:hypothetical protein